MYRGKYKIQPKHLEAAICVSKGAKMFVRLLPTDHRWSSRDFMLFCCYSFAATAYFFRFDKNYIRGCFVQEGADDCTSMRLICDCSCLLFVRWDLNCVVLMFECNRAEWSAIYVFFVCVSASSVSSSHAICVNCVLSSGLEACAMHQCIITYVYIHTS